MGRRMNYIQKEFKKIYGSETCFSDETTFQIVKVFYLGEKMKLENKKRKKIKKEIE